MQHHRPHLPRAKQSGVVLIVAMIMLVVIGLASVAVMRNVMSNDIVSDNNRRQTQAMQAAQAGLRFCEAKVLASSLVPTAEAATTDAEAWNTFSNWLSAADKGGPSEVDQAYLINTASKDVWSKRYDAGNAPKPQCMAQFRNVAGGQVVIVTSRGFSDNYQANNDTGRTEAGSVVWLQSIIQLAAAE